MKKVIEVIALRYLASPSLKTVIWLRHQ